jgi:uncharacterized protein
MKRSFVRALLAGMLTVGFTTTIAAQSSTAVDARKAAVAQQLLETTHAADQVLSAIETQLPALRAINPGLADVFWDRFVAQARARRNEFVMTLVPAYAKAFELSELQELLRFYNSPVGRRLLEAQPGLTRESVQAGQAWAARISADVRQQLTKEGVPAKP